MHSMLHGVDFAETLAPQAAGSSVDQDGDTLDMQGYDGVIFVVAITDSANTGVATLTVKDGAQSDGSDAIAIDGAAASETATVADGLNGKLLVVDVYKPRGRYVTPNVGSAAANIAFGTVVAIRYGGRHVPREQGDTVAAYKTVIPTA